MALHDWSNVFYPPVGIVHITKDIGQLVEPFIDGKSCIHINTSAQPNSHPHLGTVTTLMTAFAIGEHLGKYFSLPVKLTFDQLENAPGEKVTKNGIEYQKSLGDLYEGEISLAEKYMASFKWVFDELSERTRIPYEVCPYFKFQQKRVFRQTLLSIMHQYQEFSHLLSPSEKVIRIRFPCPLCSFVDKKAASVKIEELQKDNALFSFECFEHGKKYAVLSEDSQSFIDTNTPLRDVAKGCTLISESQANKELAVMVDGSDWGGVWNMRIFCDGITRLGYSYQSLPFRFFAPVITDWSGAKFSKSLYVRNDAYTYLPQGLLNFQEFLKVYGMAGFDVIWREVKSWADDPQKLFRSYSVDYFNLLLESGGNRES